MFAGNATRLVCGTESDLSMSLGQSLMQNVGVGCCLWFKHVRVLVCW